MACWQYLRKSVFNDASWALASSFLLVAVAILLTFRGLNDAEENVDEKRTLVRLLNLAKLGCSCSEECSNEADTSLNQVCCDKCSETPNWKFRLLVKCYGCTEPCRRSPSYYVKNLNLCTYCLGNKEFTDRIDKVKTCWCPEAIYNCKNNRSYAIENNECCRHCRLTFNPEISCPCPQILTQCRQKEYFHKNRGCCTPCFNKHKIMKNSTQLSHECLCDELDTYCNDEITYLADNQCCLYCNQKNILKQFNTSISKLNLSRCNETCDNFMTKCERGVNNTDYVCCIYCLVLSGLPEERPPEDPLHEERCICLFIITDCYEMEKFFEKNARCCFYCAHNFDVPKHGLSELQEQCQCAVIFSDCEVPEKYNEIGACCPLCIRTFKNAGLRISTANTPSISQSIVTDKPDEFLSKCSCLHVGLSQWEKHSCKKRGYKAEDVETAKLCKSRCVQLFRSFFSCLFEERYLMNYCKWCNKMVDHDDIPKHDEWWNENYIYEKMRLCTLILHWIHAIFALLLLGMSFVKIFTQLFSLVLLKLYVILMALLACGYAYGKINFVYETDDCHLMMEDFVISLILIATSLWLVDE